MRVLRLTAAVSVAALALILGVQEAGAASTATPSSAAAPDTSAPAPSSSPNQSNPMRAGKTTDTPCPGLPFSLQVTIPYDGFDPLTASDDDLKANGLPPRPTDAAMAKTWQKYVTHPIHHETDCAHFSQVTAASSASAQTKIAPNDAGPLASGGTQDGGPSSASPSSGITHNWSGNVARNANGDAEAHWYLPFASGTGASSTWVGYGLGNFSTYPLYQAGDAAEGDGSSYLWMEIYPQAAEYKISYLQMNPGDLLAVHVTASTSGATFHIVDESVGYDASPHWTVAGHLDGHAEFIYERPQFNGNYTVLANAETTFSDAMVTTASGWTSIGAASHSYENMENYAETKVLAFPGPISSDGLSFHEYYRGQTAPESC